MTSTTSIKGDASPHSLGKRSRDEDPKAFSIAQSLAHKVRKVESADSLTKETSQPLAGASRQDTAERGAAVMESAAFLLSLGSSNANPSVTKSTPTPGAGNKSKNPNLSRYAVSEPSNLDVLCGRGRGYFCHPGNRRMLGIVEMNKPRYRVANKTRKTEIVKEVTDEIESGGSHFLRRGPTLWCEVTASEKHKKVCHCLREDKGNSDTQSIDSTLTPPKQNSNPNAKEDAKSLLSASRENGEARGKSRSPKTVLDQSSSRASPDGGNDQKSLVRLGSKRRLPTNKRPVAVETKELPLEAASAKPQDVANTETKPDHPVSSPPSGGRNELDILGMAASIQMQKEQGQTGNTEAPSSKDSSQFETAMLKADRASLADYSAQTMLLVERQRAELLAQAGIVVHGEPSQADILFGCDPSFHSHPGNLHLRKLIQSSISYPPSPPERRIVLTRGILAETKLAGGRFLTKRLHSDPGPWHQMNAIDSETLIFRALEEEELKLSAALSRGGSLGIGGALDYRNHLNFLSSGMYAAAGQAGPNPEAAATLAVKQSAQNNNVEASPRADKKSPSLNVLAPRVGPASEKSDSDEDIPKDEKRPGPYDVICGRGRGNFRHSGNRRMLRMFWDCKARYNAATKTEKTMIGRMILQDITKKGGRFLKRGSMGWEEVDYQVALRKVCHGIRDTPNDPEMRKRSVVATDGNGSDHGDDSGSEDAGSLLLLKPRTRPETRDELLVQKKTESALSPAEKKSATSHVSAVAGSTFLCEQQYQRNMMLDSQGQDASQREGIERARDIDVVCGRGRGNFVSRHLTPRLDISAM